MGLRWGSAERLGESDKPAAGEGPEYVLHSSGSQSRDVMQWGENRGVSNS